MKQCPACGQLNEDHSPVCPRCGTAFPPPPGPPGPPAFLPRSAAPLPPLAPKVFTWMDVFTVLGFVSSVLGYFFASVLLLPLGLIASILGFRGYRTRGLAVAGIVISAIGLLIKIMAVLDELALLPHWFTNGVW